MDSKASRESQAGGWTCARFWRCRSRASQRGSSAGWGGRRTGVGPWLKLETVDHKSMLRLNGIELYVTVKVRRRTESRGIESIL